MESNAQQVTTPATGGKRTRAEAAALAAATFAPNRVSLFDSARVNGAALKAALRDVAQRVVLSTPGIAATSTVSVVFAGEQALVRHDWRSVNAKRELVVTAAVFLPDVDEAAAVPRALADEMLAMLLHEIAHAFYTRPDAFRAGINTLAQKHGVPHDRARDVINSIEDVRIERALMASGYASGFSGVVGALLGRCMAEAIDAGALHAFRAGDVTTIGFAIAYGLRQTASGRAYVPGGDVIRGALAPALRRAYDAAASVYTIPANAEGTRRVVALADQVLGMLPRSGNATGGDAGEGDGNAPGDGAQPGANGPQGDAGEGGEGKAPATPGDAPEGDAGKGDADAEQSADEAEAEGDAQGEGGEPGDAGEGGDADADAPGAAADEGEGDGASAGGESATPSGKGSAEGKAPAPGTFTSEPRIMAVPVACKPTTAAQLFAPRITAPAAATDEALARGMATLGQAQARLQGKGGAVVTHLRRMFSRSDRDAMETGKRHGRIRVAALARTATGADNVFMKRDLVDGAAAACAVLIDGSGSMGRLSEMANNAALLLVQALAKCPGVKTQIQVFQDGGNMSAAAEQIMHGANELGFNTRNATFSLHTFKRFADNVATAYANARPVAGGSTPDLEALAYVGRDLAKRPEPRKVLLVLIDGGSARSDAIAAECKHLERVGVHVVALGLQYDCHGFTHAVRVDDMRSLAGAAMRHACDAVSSKAGA